MNETALGCCNTKAEPTVGSQLLSMARQIASEAEIMSKGADEKLAAISRTPEPRPDMNGGENKIQRAWPPYFDELRAVLNDISKYIVATSRTISRVEL